jgi:hypothetical protein
MSRIEDLATEITRLYKPIESEPFPYDDCWNLLKSVNDSTVKYLNPDLDLYFSDVASHATGMKWVLKWSASKAAESRQKLSRSFYEKHPQYERIRPLITPESTPMLHRHIETTERVRHLLLDLFAQIEAREPAPVKT